MKVSEAKNLEQLDGMLTEGQKVMEKRNKKAR